MAYDLTGIMKEETKLANAVKERESKFGEGGDYKYKILYPYAEGKLTVKFLYNPKSNMFKRQVFKHAISEENKIVCLRTYGEKCELDPILKSVENMTGSKFYKQKSRGRGVSFVEFVSSDYKVDGIEPGEIILLSYPWTIFKDLGTILSQAKTEEDATKIIASNEGFLIDIIHATDYKYSAKINPFEKHKTINLHADGEPEDPKKVELENKKFNTLLENLDPLDEQLAPSELSDEIVMAIREAKKNLENTYFKTVDPNAKIDKESVDLSTPPPRPLPNKREVETVINAQPATSSDNGKPSCFGKFGEVDYNTQCLRCQAEIECSDSSSDVPF